VEEAGAQGADCAAPPLPSAAPLGTLPAAPSPWGQGNFGHV
jgi:hypothetical protein